MKYCSILIPILIFSLFFMKQEQGLPLPEWAQGGVYEKLQALSDIYNLYKNVSPTMFKLLTGIRIILYTSYFSRKTLLRKI